MRGLDAREYSRHHRSMSNAENQWPTIAEAAEIIGISERTARRYATAPENAARTRHETRRTQTGTRQALCIAPELVEKLRNEHRHNAAPTVTEHGENAAQDGATVTNAARTPAEQEKQGGTNTANAARDATPSTRNTANSEREARVLAERECELLREALQRERENADQWRNQVEAANRDAAELRAALRKALDSMPKQITGEYSRDETNAQKRQDEPKRSEPNNQPGTTKDATQRTPRREPRSLLRLLLGLR